MEAAIGIERMTMSEATERIAELRAELNGLEKAYCLLNRGEDPKDLVDGLNALVEMQATSKYVWSSRENRRIFHIGIRAVTESAIQKGYDDCAEILRRAGWVEPAPMPATISDDRDD